MNKYELLYIVSMKIEDEKREELITRFANLVTANGGEVEVSKWGVRKLAYPIQFQNEGFYVQMNFTADSSFPLEIERQMKIVDAILRFVTVKKIENKLTVAAAARKESARKARAEAVAVAASEAPVEVAAEVAVETVAEAVEIAE